MIRHVLNTLGFRRSALAVGLGVPFLVATSAFAQAPAEATTERVVVTGTYIPTAETESALPVTVYTAEVLQKAGSNTPVEGLRQLPSFIGNAATENDSNGGNGAATINLRGLGPNNVLILINGRRATLGITNNGAPDINAIPISAISRTEVLKDGASAIYGSDAVAGVVNFIMLNGPGEAPYEGAEAFALYGNTTETDAHVRQVWLKGGVKTDKVSVAAAGEYYSRANLFSRDRAQLAGTGDLSNDSTGLGRGGINNNSPTLNGRISLAGAASAGFGQRILINQSTFAPTAASYREFDNPGGSDPGRFNFREYTPAIPAIEKALYYITGRYKIFGENLQIYGDVMYAKTKQDNGLAASPFTIPLGGYVNPSVIVLNDTGTASLGSLGGGSTTLQRAIIQNSPFNPFPGRNGATTTGSLQTMRYRTVEELGLRKSFYDHDYYRYVGGFNGDFNFKDNGFISHFGYDTGIVYERYDEKRTDSGDATRGGVYNEIINTTAQYLVDPTFAGFNPFVGLNAPKVGVAPIYNAAGVQIGTRPYNNTLALQRASYLGQSFFYERDWAYDATVNAHFFPNLYNGGVDFAIGYQYRQLSSHQVPDPVQNAGDQLGFNAAPNTKFKQEVNSVFMEMTFPIITSTMNISFVRSLEFGAAWRYEKFEDKDQYTHQTASFDNVNEDENFGGTPRFSLRYQPIPDLTVRANFNQSFLTPTPAQLFNPLTQNFPVIFDPHNPSGPLTLQPPNGVWQGGNPALLPEKTDTWSAGLVWTPKWLPGFTVTADWYQIYTKDVILPAANAAQLLVTLNIADPDPPQGGANGITRDPNDGTLLSVDSANANSAKRLVQGLDITATYEIPTQHWGTFTWSFGWNHFFTWKAEAVTGLGTTNFLGDFNTALPLTPGGIPFNKAFLRFEWNGMAGWAKGLDFVMTGNYIGDYEDDPSFILGNEQIGGTDANPSFAQHHRISAYETLDMQLSYEFLKPEVQPVYAKDAKDSKGMGKEVAGVENSSIWQRMLWNTKVTIGVNNAFDRYPPTVLGAFNDNYDTSNYSIRNRYWYVSLTKRF